MRLDAFVKLRPANLHLVEPHYDTTLCLLSDLHAFASCAKYCSPCGGKPRADHFRGSLQEFAARHAMRWPLGESTPVLFGEFLNGEALFDEGNGAVKTVAEQFILSLCNFVFCLLPVIVTALYASCFVSLCFEGSHAVYRTTLPYGFALFPFETAEHHRTHAHCFIKGVQAHIP